MRKAKIDLMMAKLNRFVIVGDEGPQEMFDRLMVLVGKIRGYGGDLDDHKLSLETRRTSSTSPQVMCSEDC